MSYSDWLESARGRAVQRLLERAPKNERAGGWGRRVGDYRAELLERRLFLSAATPIATPPITVTPIGGGQINRPGVVINTSAPFAPSDIQKAYGVNSISFSGVSGTGAGQTIAIIDAYNDPNIAADAATFNTQFSLPQFNTTGNATFTILNQTGGTTLPTNATSSNGGWDTEISLDVEWAHAIAPKANIILFEANSAGGTDLYTAVATAAAYSGVSVVSMSFGSPEFSSEHSYDSYFTTPNGHQGVTFFASTGDSSAPAEYPALSPNVVAVGGTSLTLGTGSTYTSESTWGNGTAGASGGGGGISAYESQPSFQTGNVNGLSSTKRTAPDVSMLADPNTGVYMYDSWAGGAGNGGYYIAGGTSLACPMWAGLVAIADQGRAASSLPTLDGPSQTLPRLYQMASSNFHDITTGSNGFNAGTGYDLATGLGTPIANFLVPALAGITATASRLSFSVSPSTTTAGVGISSISVQVIDSFGDLDTSDSSNVTLAIGTNAGGGTLSGTLTVAAVNGVATFTGLSINKAGTGYTLTATDGSLSSATSSSFTINAASASQLVVTHQPSASTVGVIISPAVTVSVEDAFGNIITGNNSTVTLTLSSGATFTAGGTTTSVAASSGVATFSSLNLATAGTFTFTASDGALTPATTSSFTIAQATPIVGVTDAGGTYSGSAFSVTAAFADDPNSGATLAGFGSGLLSYSYYAGTLTTALQVSGATPLGSVPIAAGAYTVVATYSGNANYNSASSSPINYSIAKRALHVTAIGQNKTYDGTTTDTATLSDDRISGDTLTISDGSAIFLDKNVNNAISVSVTSISMGGSSSGNYTLANTAASTTANITALAITGSITANNKTYDNTTAATLATRTLTGVLNGDSVTLTGGSATFNSKDVATANTVTATSLTLSGAQAADYTLSNPTELAAANISPLSITGSFSASNKVYDNTTAATIATRSLTGVLGSDSISLTGGTATFNIKDVATATTVTATGLSLTGAQATNYTLSDSTETAGASITPLGITGTVTASNKTYDQTTTASIIGRSVTGVLGSDSVSLIGGTGTFNSKDVLTATTVTVTGLSLSGAQASDYSLSNPTETASASITTLGVTGSIIANDKVYDGTTAATYSSGTFTGLLSGDVVLVTGGVASFNSKDVSSATTVTVTGLTLTGAQAADYSLGNTTETDSASITPLGINGSITASGKTYDGTNSATLATRTLTGVINGDDVSLTGGTATFNSSQVSLATTVTAVGLSLTGAQAGDYSLNNSTETAAASITPLGVTGSITANNKIYDNTTAATLATRTLTSILAGDVVTLTGGVATFNSKDVTTATTVTATGLALSGAQASDYSLSNPTETASASITPLSITGSIVASSKVYDGTIAATLVSRTLTGVLGSDSVSLIGGLAQFNSADVSTATTVGTTGSLSGAQAGDYSLSNPTESASANITPLPIIVTITAAGKTYNGSTAATITGRTLTGVLNTDDVTATGGTATFSSKDVANGKTVTATGIALTGAQAGDYSIADPAPTTMANITPVALTGSFVAANKVYDGTTNATVTSYIVNGIVGSDIVTVSASSVTFDTKDVGNGKTVTANGLTLTGAQAGDYTLSNPTQTSTANITPFALTANVIVANKIYDGTTPAKITSRTLTGVKGSDSVTLIGGTGTFNTKDADTANTVTVTGLSLTGRQAGDYTLASTTAHATAHITPLAISGNITAADKIYDATTTASLASESLTGVLSGDSVNLTGGSAFFDTKDVGTGKTVTATGLTLGGAQAADYSLGNTTETTTASITPLTITGSITANNKVYDGTTAATLATESLTGVFAGDSVSLTGGGATFNTADVPTANTVTATGLSITGPQAGDYVLANSTEAAAASITPLTVTGSVTASDKLFDGTTTATLASKSLTGVLGNDQVTLAAGTAVFATSTVGNGKPVTVTGLTLAGASAADYTLANPTENTTASIAPLAISGTVFNDASTDGIQQNAETGLSGRVVTLQIAGKGTKGQKTAKTDINGNFTFTNLAIGSYVVKVTPPAHWRNTSAAGNGDTVTLQPGQANPALQFGQTDDASVSGTVFLDANKDGKKQAKEGGLSGWTVVLTANGSATPYSTTTTDANGNYTFSAVPIGGYQISIVESSGYSPTKKSKGTFALSLTAGKIVTAENFGQQLGAGVKQKVVKSRHAA